MYIILSNSVNLIFGRKNKLIFLNILKSKNNCNRTVWTGTKRTINPPTFLFGNLVMEDNSLMEHLFCISIQLINWKKLLSTRKFPFGISTPAHYTSRFTTYLLKFFDFSLSRTLTRKQWNKTYAVSVKNKNIFSEFLQQKIIKIININ